MTILSNINFSFLNPITVILKSKELLCLLVLIMGVLGSNGLFAEEDDDGLSLKQMLLTPGDLTQPHAEFDKKCKTCHVHFEKSNQSPLCIECHEEIDDDLNKKSGFHGTLPTKQTAECKLCHTDHQGRDFDITGMDRENFDHSMTNFKLEGAHENTLCSSCHTNKRMGAINTGILPLKGILELPVDKGFRFKQFECNSCHIDFHEIKQTLGDKCDDCHSLKGWTVENFEHDKTEYPLEGVHRELKCDSCHINDQYKKIGMECQSCHIAKDSHLGVFGAKCDDCHSTEKWENNAYEHLKQTGWALKGSHIEIKGKDVRCIDCHFEELKPKTECVACHKGEDIHLGSNGTQCEDCHTEKSWEVNEFDHEAENTGFTLIGAHETIKCDACHIPGNKRNLIISMDESGALMETSFVRGCIDCHLVDDPHFAKLGRDCGKCHAMEDWQKSIRFNHDFNDFPLTGSHQLLVCESCHLSAEFSEQSQKCVSCHKSDDYHKGTLGVKCASCHDTSVWSHWTFDHQKNTDFPLIGAHEDLQCSGCHTSDLVDSLKPKTDCYSCHKIDDVHEGGFGTDCEQCHVESKFSELGL